MGFFSKLFGRGRLASAPDADTQTQTQTQTAPPRKPPTPAKQPATSPFGKPRQMVLHPNDREARDAQTPPSETQTPQDLFLAGLYKLTIGGDFQSSNPKRPAVYQVWYVPQEETMYVTYFAHTKKTRRIGPTYKYWTVTLDEARRMFLASSKGRFVWDTYRVRGTLLHTKSYARV